MPYHIARSGSKYNVVVDATGKVVGSHPNKAEAQAQLGALYSNVPEASSKTLKCLSCLQKGQGPCWDGYEYAGTKEQDGKTVPNCIPAKKAMEKLLLTGGDGWYIEFNTPDCQHGWAVMKSGTAQSSGCYLTKEEAEKALEGLNNPQVNLLGDETRTAQSPSEYADSNVHKCMTCGCGDLGNDHDVIPDTNKSIWDGVFSPASHGIFDPGFHSQNQDDRYYFPSKATYENDGKPSAGYGNRSSNNTTP